MRDAVSSAMRMLSEEPFTFGVPLHCATEGIFAHAEIVLCRVRVQWVLLLKVGETWLVALGVTRGRHRRRHDAR